MYTVNKKAGVTEVCELTCFEGLFSCKSFMFTFIWFVHEVQQQMTMCVYRRNPNLHIWNYDADCVKSEGESSGNLHQSTL